MGHTIKVAPIVRLADGGTAPNWPAAFVVYAAMAVRSVVR